MINILVSLIIILFVSYKNLLFYQLQYYDNKRFLKLKIKEFNYKDLCYLPLAVIDLFLNNNLFRIGSLVLILLYKIPKREKLTKLKFTFRVIRLYIFIILISLFAFISINQFYLLITYSLISLNFLIILLANFFDSFIRIIIDNYYIRALKKKINDIKPIIIGITGSYGKTSTKEYLTNILKLKYNVLATKGNINTFKGVVSFLNKNLVKEINILIIEIGLDKRNGINKFLKLFKFDYAFLTGLEKCHLSTFKCIENIIKEKMKLLNSAKVGFFNLDNNYLKKVNYEGYSLNDIEKRYYSDGKFRFKLKKYKREFISNVIGDQHLINIIGIIKFLKLFKFDDKLIYQGVASLENKEHRYKLRKFDDLLIIDDAYNSNETSFKMALDSLKYFPFKKILMTPGVIELGKENKEVNYRLALYSINKVDEVILIGSNALTFKKSIY